MKQQTRQSLLAMNIISWIIFTGLCIKTGSTLFSFFVSLYINPEGAKTLYLGLNLFELLTHSIWKYSLLIFMILFIWALKAYMFYYAIKIFKKINLIQPFSTIIVALIAKISYLALTVGVIAIAATSFTDWMMKRGFDLPRNLQQYVGGGAEFLFIAGIIFIVELIFKSGIEIQSENELTV